MIAAIVVVLLLILLWNIPIGIVAEYSEGGATVKAKISFLRILLYPREKKEKREKTPETDQPEATKQVETAPKPEPVKKPATGAPKTTGGVLKATAAASSPPEKKSVSKEPRVAEKPKEKPAEVLKAQEKPEITEQIKPAEEQNQKNADMKTLIGGNLPLFRELLGLALAAVGRIRRKLEITDLKLHLSLGGFGDDPANAAMLYAKAWAAIGALTPVLENSFTIRKRDVQASVDFTDTENWIYGFAELTLKLGQILMIALYYGLRGLKIFLKIKKGGKNNGTSDQ